MKRNLILLLLFYFSSETYAQRLEWYETFTAKGQINNQIFYPNVRILVHSVKNKIVVSGLTCSKSIGVEGTGQLLLTGSNNNSDAYFACFNDKGELENSQIIYTPNGQGGPESIGSFAHNPSNDFIYCNFTTYADSIRFNNTMPWLTISKKDKYTHTSFLVVYDNNFKYVTSYPFYSYNGCTISEVKTDKQGNIFINGYYRDSLKYEGKLLLKKKSIYEMPFFMKINIDNKVEWVNDGLTGTSYYNESRNSIYQIFGLEKSRYSIIYNNKDSIVFPATNYNRTILAEFSLTSGHIKQYTTINTGDTWLNPVQLKGNDNTLILNSYVPTSGLAKIKIGLDSFSFVTGQSNNFINSFNASDLKHKFINFFDSTKYGGGLKITNIYNDSLYSITGATRGNQNFGFKGSPVFARDYLKTRPVHLASDFLVTYTTTNRLKDLWYLTTDPSSNYSSFENSATVFSNDGDIYIGANIPYHSELGLGTRKFNYAAGNRSLTLLKYSCKPTAFYTYTMADTKVSFTNHSSGLCNYTWQFSKSDFAYTKDAVYQFPKSGGVFFPRLIVTNSCGVDTFYTQITIAPSSVITQDKIHFTIYPNPASSKITVQFENEPNSKNLHFKLYDICGKEVDCLINKTKNTTYEMDVQTISNGIYFLLIQNNDFNLSQKISVLK